MRLYELAYLISTEVKDEEIVAFQDKVSNWIKEGGGILTEINKPIKKRLAYPIKKNRQAYLGVLDFQIEQDKLSNLEKKLKTDQKVIRYLIIIKKIRMKVEIRRRTFQKISPPTPKFERLKEEKVGLEAIEEKLEEILGE